MDDQKRIDELERELLDERRERDTAQRRAAKLTQNVDVWRKRAEDRSERIKKLETERERLRGVGGWLRRARSRKSVPSDSVSRTVEAQIESETAVPRLPAVRCVTAAENVDLLTGVSVFDSVPFSPSVSLLGADVVLVDGAGLRALPTDDASAVNEWADLDVRPPLVVTDDVPPALRDRADGVIGAEDISGRFFDPQVWNPSRRSGSAGAGAVQPSESAVHPEVEGFGAAIAGAYDLNSTRSLELAASGTPFVAADHGQLTADGLHRLGASYRRFAFEHRHVELTRLIDQLMLDVPQLRPRVAALLVSNQPEDVVAAIERVGEQGYRPLELIVGCHGFSQAVVAGAVSRLPHDVSVSVREFSAQLSLGQCLNESISESGANVIAKMDDDDHYGPNYLIDAVHALEYSGASIIGKATSYTYIESEDRTVLRRPGYEEMLYNGSPTGATLVWERSVWERVPFPHRTIGEDYAFLRGARRLGINVYVNTRFEFVYRRHRSGNTWQAPDRLFTEGSAVGWDGDHPSNADVPAMVVSET